MGGARVWLLGVLECTCPRLALAIGSGVMYANSGFPCGSASAGQGTFGAIGPFHFRSYAMIAKAVEEGNGGLSDCRLLRASAASCEECDVTGEDRGPTMTPFSTRGGETYPSAGWGLCPQRLVD